MSQVTTAQNEDVTTAIGPHDITEDHPITLNTNSATSKAIIATQDNHDHVTNTTPEDFDMLTTGDSIIIKYATTPADMKQGLTDNPIQESADSEKLHLHYIIPGYASLGLSVMLFISFGIIILFILVKVFRKVPKPPSCTFV